MARRAATLALLGYLAALLLAACPPEVRPPLLAAPGETARKLLRAVGIRPGVAVFEASQERMPRVIRNDCIRVRGLDAEGSARPLAPADGRCFTRGARLFVPWTEGALRSVVLRAPPGVAEPALGDWFCHGPHWRGRGIEAVELLWTEPWLALADRSEGEDAAALFVWRCDPPGLVARRLRPSDVEVRRLAPEP